MHEPVEVIIVNFNRLDPFKKLVEWLKVVPGVRAITVIDNASSYPPLLDYYASERSFRVLRFPRNGTHLAPLGYLHAEYSPGQRFIVTDPDLVPYDDCPKDVVSRLQDLLDRHQKAMKVGVGLPVDDLPDHYPFKALVQRHMNKISGQRIEDGVFECIVDTTFALYRSREAFGDWQLPALRTGRPYVFRHVDWYVDPDNLSDEEIYYLDHASKVATYAGLMREWFRERNRDWHATQAPHSKQQKWRDKLRIRVRDLLAQRSSKS